jgi:hypothetical protein
MSLEYRLACQGASKKTDGSRWKYNSRASESTTQLGVGMYSEWRITDFQSKQCRGNTMEKEERETEVNMDR